jgi:hypothetical protein
MRKNFLPKLTFGILLGIISSCAASYKSVAPETFSYNSKHTLDSVELQYKYAVLRDRGNNKMANKEDKRNIKLVAVKITNNSNDNITVGEQYKFFSGNKELELLRPEYIQQTVKQNSLSYLPYLLLTFWQLQVTVSKQNEYGSIEDKTNVFPIGLVVGPGITAFNIIKASKSNNKFLDELNKYSLINQPIKPGETKFGLIGIDAGDYDPLMFKNK